MFHTNLMNISSDDDLLMNEHQIKLLDELHKRVLPFVMRREKSQVLKELP